MKSIKKTLLVTFIATLILSVDVYAANSYSEDFDDGNADDWIASNGSWSVSNTGESSYYYEQTDSSAEFFSYGGETFWADYSFEVKIKRVDTTGWGSCDLIGRRNGADFYLIQIGPSNVQIWNVTAANSWVSLAKANTTNALDTWYTYKLEMVGDVITVYKDNVELMAVTDPNPILSGQIGFRTFKAHCRFDDVLVTNLGAPWPSGQASGPYPPGEETDVPRDAVLSWMPGEYASTLNGHMVYFSDVFDDVSNGVGGIAQSANSFTPSQLLEFGTTYYWRVDEVNGPPDYTVHQGDIWSFTAEPVAYPVDGLNIIATASDSFSPDTGPENTVNGSGLDADGLHSDQQTDMWMTGLSGPQPSWIQYEFDKVYKLHEMWVWNYNQNIEPLVGFGLKDVTIEYSSDGVGWTELAGVPEFTQALGMPGYAHDTTIDFGGAPAKYVRVTANDNWGMLTQYGLSEVRFFYIPVRAREPKPDSGAMDVDMDVTLNFRAGREATEHDLYISTDEQAVIDGTASVTTMTETGHGPLQLDLGQTYYWKVNEVNVAETPATWEGDIWSFSTPGFIVVDDFEDYNDYEPDRIFDAWIDGWEIPTNGSTVGYPDPIFSFGEHFVETGIVHGGNQSMPLFYDNTAGATYSEAELTLSPSQDWTKYNIHTLSLSFYGDPNNVAGQMYVKVNGAEVLYDGDPDNITQATWQPWNIELSSLGVNLTNITRLAIGFRDAGSGLVFIDDIRLYADNQ